MSNLLDKASVVLTPTGFNNGEVLCVKPDDSSGDFQFSRNSAATRVNSEGLVEDVQILSSNLVQNGDFSQLGSEEVTNGSFSQQGSQLITNGDFSNGSTDWTLGTGWSISGGTANYDGLQASQLLRQGTANGVVGKTFLVKYDVVNNSGVGGILAKFGGVNLSAYNKNNGSFEFYIVAVSTDYIRFIPQLDFNGSIDNVSVVEVGQDWVLFGGAEITAQGARINNTITGTNCLIRQDNSNFTAGKSFVFEYDVVATNGATLAIEQASAVSLNTSTIGNNRKVYFQWDRVNDNLVIKRLTTETDVTITNISVKEVGQDWSVTDLDANNFVVFNGSTARLKFLNTSPLTKLQSTAQIISGKKYKLIVDVAEVVSGGIKIDAAGVQQTYNTVGIQQSIIEPTGDQFIAFYRATANVDITLNSVSVIEITDDTNLPRINYEGFSYQDALGSELVLNGGFDTDSNWSKGSGWYIADGTATHTGGASYLSQSILEPNKQYKVKIKVIQASGSNFVQIYMGNSPASVLIQNVGEYEYIFTSQSLQTLGFALRGAGNIKLDNVSVKEYLGQEVVSGSGCGSWLWENQSTNLIPYSEDFSQWSKSSSMVITPNNVISPDGTQNATLLTANSINQFIYLSSFSAANSTISLYIKRKSGTGDIELSNNGGSSYTALSVTDEWSRAQVTFAAATNQTVLKINTSGDEIYLWGAQVEEQSYSTSYIPTDGTQKTRNQDVCNNGGSVSTINSTSGVLYFEGLFLGPGYRFITLNSGSANRVSIYSNSPTTISFNVKVGGANQFNGNYSIDTTINHKVALKYKENDFALWIDGIEVATDNNGITFATDTLNEFSFDDGNGGSKFFGKTKALAVFPFLTDTELQELTTI